MYCKTEEHFVFLVGCMYMHACTNLEYFKSMHNGYVFNGLNYQVYTHTLLGETVSTHSMHYVKLTRLFLHPTDLYLASQ